MWWKCIIILSTGFEWTFTWFRHIHFGDSQRNLIIRNPTFWNSSSNRNRMWCNYWIKQEFNAMHVTSSLSPRRRIGIPQSLPRSTSIDSIIQSSSADATNSSSTTTTTAAGGAVDPSQQSSSQCLSVSFSSSPNQHPQFLQVHQPANNRRESLLSPSSGRRSVKTERGIPGNLR